MATAKVKNCRTVSVNAPGKGAPWGPFEVRELPQTDAEQLATLSGFKLIETEAMPTPTPKAPKATKAKKTGKGSKTKRKKA